MGSGCSTAAAGGTTTTADKDREVAEFLNRHGVNRDGKTVGTKWDNMLGEFRKVYEWERGAKREQIGKSYFILSPYERKIHRLLKPCWNLKTVIGYLPSQAAEGARIAGASRIISVDLNARRFEQVKQFGVTEFVNPTDYSKPVQGSNSGTVGVQVMLERNVIPSWRPLQLLTKDRH